MLDGDAAVLPRIVPLGDIDEDELIFADAASGADALELPDAARRARAAHAARAPGARMGAAAASRAAGEPPLVVHSPASALALADDLARLIDDMTTRQVSLGQARRAGAGPSYDRYWQLTLEFLKIAREALAGRSCRSAARSSRRRGAIC